MTFFPSATDPTLTHLQIVLADAQNTAMIYSCASADIANDALNEWKNLESRAFTVITDNGGRYSFNSTNTLYIEQITAEEAKRRLDAFAAAQKQQQEALAEAEAQAREAAARQPFIAPPKIVPVPGHIRR